MSCILFYILIMKIAAWAVRFFEKLARQGWRAKAEYKFFYGLLKLIRPRSERIDLNLDLIYPEHKGDEAWHKEFKNKIYQNFAWDLAEIFAAQKDINQVSSWVKEVEGFDYIKNFLDDRNQGLLFMSGHYCSWELLAYWYSNLIRAHGGKLYAVAQNMHDKDLTAILNEYRAKAGITVLPKDISTFEIVKLLKKGAHIAVLNDVAWTGGELLPFLGQLCTNTTGPATLAMLSGVPIISVGIYRLDEFKYKIKFLEPFHVDNNNNNLSKRERIEQATIKINNNLGEIISQQPELWFWLHNRWKLNKLKKNK